MTAVRVTDSRYQAMTRTAVSSLDICLAQHKNILHKITHNEQISTLFIINDTCVVLYL